MKKVILFILLAMVAVVARSQVLYSLNGKGLAGESYLLFVDGMLPTSTLIGVKDVFRCYNRTQAVVCEQSEETSWDRVKKMMLDSALKLSMTIKYSEIGMVDSVLRADTKMSLAKVEQLKPGVVRMIWEQEICRSLYQRGEDDMAMESYFQQVAILEGKNIVVLNDSVTYAILQESVEQQARGLVEAFSCGRDSVVRRYRMAESLYREGDVLGLAAMHDCKNDESRMDAWIGKMVEAMKREKCMIVVHARYADVLERLKKQKIKIKEVK